jgi:uncharacterized protein (DUF2235 family)
VKNIAIFCDGTWQHLDQPFPTNVANLARAVTHRAADGSIQMVYYDDGVGVSSGVLDAATHLLGGALGKGLDYKITRAYEFLALNFEPRDKVFIFGFSRGAYTARSLAGLIRWMGFLKRENAGHSFEAMALYRTRPAADANQAEQDAFQAKAKAFRATYGHHAEPFVGAKTYKQADPKSLTPDDDCGWLQYVGVWDTVGSLGVPTNIAFAPVLNAQYRFYDTNLSRFVRSARHAVSIDERRKTFAPTLWDNIDDLNDNNADAGALPYDARPYQQQWFPGTHGGVGGGSSDGGLSLAAMLWIAEGAVRAGLSLDAAQTGHYATLAHPDAQFIKAGFDLGGFVMELDGVEDRKGPADFDEVSLSARLRWAKVGGYRPAPLQHVEDAMGGWQIPADPQAYFKP